MTAAVSLRAITDANRTAILALQVAPHQQKWIASNEISLLQAVEYSQVSPEHFAIYADETPVGFCDDRLHSDCNKEERPGLARLAIDDRRLRTSAAVMAALRCNN